MQAVLLLALAASAAPVVRVQKTASFISPSVKAGIAPLGGLTTLPLLAIKPLPVLGTLPKVEISASAQLSDLKASLADTGDNNDPQTSGNQHFDGLKAETGDVELGLLPSIGDAAGEKEMQQWRYLSFSVVTPVTQTTGDPLINGRPAEESKLEYKRVVRVVPGSNSDQIRHDISFLALGATPPGQYVITLPDGKTLTLNVRHSKDSPKRGVLGEEVPEPELAGNLRDEVRQFLANHQSYMGRHLAEYENYVKKDPLLDEAAKAAALREVELLREFYAAASSGSRDWTLGGLAAQALARDRDIMEAYIRYLEEDPSHGRAYVGFAVEQTRHYRQVTKDLHDAWSQVDSSRKPNPLVSAYSAVVTGWYKARFNLAVAWTMLKIKLSRKK